MKNSFDLVVLGGGSGGLAAAKRAASYGARVALVEGDRVGGTCVIRGCVPKKLLVYGSLYRESLIAASSFGIKLVNYGIDVEILLRNIRNEVDRLNGLHVDFLKESGVELFTGWGRFVSENMISISSRNNIKGTSELHGEKILIAVGGRPVRPDIPGIQLSWVSDDVFLQKNFPDTVVIVGAGFIACEFACILNGLGVNVTQVVRGDRLLKGFDKELAFLLQQEMLGKGIKIIFNDTPLSIEGEPSNMKFFSSKGQTISCGGVLLAIGRRPFLEGLGLEKIGIEVLGGRINIDKNYRTNIPNIFAVGDVANTANLTPVAIEEGRVFADKYFAKNDRFIDYKCIPSAVFSQPEIAKVGLTEEEAVQSYGQENILIKRSHFRPMSKALSKSGSKCFLKLIIESKSDIVLGCHMLGESAAEIIQMAAIAISMGAKKSDFDRTMALHPTVAEEFVTMI